jgi:predicted acyl esterase
VLALIPAMAGLCEGALADESATADDPPVEVTWGVRIPLRDGVQLNATLYKPLEMNGPLPVVFTLTPYTSDTYHERGWYFARHGYVFALVDARGRGNSGGEFEPFIQEAGDGHDVVEWLAAQAWCNGKVAMWGVITNGRSPGRFLPTSPPSCRPRPLSPGSTSRSGRTSRIPTTSGG